MKKRSIPFEQTGKFSPLFLDYIAQKPSLQHLFNRPHSLEGLQDIASQFKKEDRTILFDAISQQYEGIETSTLVKQNIALLQHENTYTVTTGHQLQLMTGPLFFVYKIITTINLCRELKKESPSDNFVPVFWMASEDHDFEEINSFLLFGKKHTWDSSQTGAVGEFHLEDLKASMDEWPDELAEYKAFYISSKNLSEATRKLVNHLFQEHGLLILDANDRSLKKLFVPLLKKELTTSFSFDAVSRTSQFLAENGYKTQVTPREINLFYLKDGVRERIIREGDVWKVNNTDLEFTEKQIDQLLEETPEVFSPNVILRPVYQQCILPNISYVGGPGELIYWLQLKEVFEAVDVVFPVLTPRSFGLFVNQNSQKKLDKLAIDVLSLFEEESLLRKSLVEKWSEADLDISEDKAALAKVFESLAQKGVAIDPTLKAFVEGEGKRTEKQLDTIEKKFKKAEERKLEQSITQVLTLQQRLFPNGGLQERQENLFSILLNTPNFIDDLIDVLDPLAISFNLLYDEG